MQNRPDPDALLARVQPSAGQPVRGRLKLFFGAAPGVGKTYAMLSEAHNRQQAGTDVVAGVIETHGRAETEALLEGITVLPRRTVIHRGVALGEFDLDAALARKPALLLVDELAHTNAPESRHTKRWQDVFELLDAGIDVYSTMNVQHLESLNDVVAQITGVMVRETVPDAVLERADEIELVDIPPEELLARLRDGKVYLPQQARHAIQNFFRHGNLMALRELALRRTAERVDRQMQRYRQENAIPTIWPAHDQIVVCVSPDPNAPRLVRAARRIAEQMQARWMVLYIETPATIRQGEAARDTVAQAFRLAEQLGAETRTISAASVVPAIVSYARAHNVTKVLVGPSARPRWQRFFGTSTVDALVQASSDFDVFVIHGDATGETPFRQLLQPSSPWQQYAISVAAVGVCTILVALLLLAFPDFAEANIVMAYLLVVIGLSTRLGRGPSMLASVLSVAAFDFFFVAPIGTFTASDTQYFITFGVMLVAAIVLSTQTSQLQLQATASRQREQRTAALYELSRELVSVRSIERLLPTIVRLLSSTFESQVMLLLPVEQKLQPWGGVAGWWDERIGAGMVYAPDARDMGVAQWAYEHQQIAGNSTTTLPAAEGLYVPLIGAHGTLGVLGIRSGDPQRFRSPDQMHLLETCAAQIAATIERARLSEAAQQAQVQIETERTRNALLSSVSHDLRTPLTTITGAASSLLGTPALDPATSRELLQSVYDEAERLNRLVSNLLDVTRLESGAVQLQKEWQPIEEVIGAALTRLETRLQGRSLTTNIPPDMPLVPIDAVLIEQVLVNLLDNAIKYTPPGTPLAVQVEARQNAVEVSVRDGGPGLPAGDPEQLFDKFYRAQRGHGGVGLGLAICKGIVEAHGGRIRAQALPVGAVFRFTLPIDGPPPVLDSAPEQEIER